jgi:hypothetical protein
MVKDAFKYLSPDEELQEFLNQIEEIKSKGLAL